MTTFDTDGADAMLKVVTDDALFDSVVTHSVVLDIFEQSANVVQGPHGRYVELAHMFGWNEAVGSRTELGFLPVPGTPTFVNGRIKLKKTLTAVQMTYDVMVQASKGKAAFADWAEVHLVRSEKALRDDLDRQAIGYGNGAICRVDDASPAVILNIDAPYGLANDTKGWLPGIRRGMKLVFGPNIDGSALRENGRSALVLSVDKAANGGGGAATLDRLPDGVADNDYIWKGDDLDNNAPLLGVEKEMMGLRGMVDEGTVLTTLQNISRSTFDEWKAQTIDANAAPYSGLGNDTLFMHMNDDAVELGGSDGLTHMLVSRAVFRNVYVQLRGLGGFGSGHQPGSKMKAGTKGIMVNLGTNSVEVRAVPKIFPGIAQGLDASTLRRYHLEGFEWDDRTGSIFKQVSVGQGIQDAFWAYGRTIMELGCTDPQKNSFATGLSEAQG